MRKYFKFLAGPASVLFLIGLAASAAASGVLIQSYNAGPSVLSGMLVETEARDQSTVVPLTTQGIRGMLGVVVPANDAALVLSPQSASSRQVLVAASGNYGVLVSNQDGSVKSGDYLTMSSLPGIAMKAASDQSEVIGRAGGDFDGVNNTLSTVSLKLAAGRSAKVSIGQVPVSVRLGPNPLYQKSNLPGFLSRAASDVSNKPGSIRIYLSSAVLLATLIISGVMFYGSVRSSITAIGRNPLAKREISRDLVQSVAAGLVIFLAGILAAYLILI